MGCGVQVVPGRGASRYKGPETGTDWECLRTRRKAGHGDTVGWGIRVGEQIGER